MYYEDRKKYNNGKKDYEIYNFTEKYYNRVHDLLLKIFDRKKNPNLLTF